jgi:putative tryptophan/tyrosine transport system substrate-binding protein
MQRREFIKAIAGSAAAWPLAASAQQPTMPVIGFLGSLSASDFRVEALRAGLRDRGYVQGKNIAIEFRWAEGNYDRLPTLVADLVRLKVDVIVTHGTPGSLAAKQATTTIPIVLAAVADPLASGIVSNLARPGGNVTGLTFFNPEIAAKRLELLKEALPGLTDVGILLNSANPANDPTLSHMSSVAQHLKLELHQFDARAPTEFEAAFAAMVTRRVGAFVVVEDPMLISNAPAVAALALQQRLPSCAWPDFAVAGGLMAYGVNFPDMFRRAATLVDKILKGEKPGDLPIERATKFETIVNLKSANALGLSIPYNLLARADEVIE